MKQFMIFIPGPYHCVLYIKICRKVIGLESIPASVADAGENALLNGITNAAFHAGDIAKILDREFFEIQQPARYHHYRSPSKWDA